MRVLLTESASLTARETLTVLGRAGIRADVVDSGRWAIGRFSRWRGRVVRLPPPGVDPVGYLRCLGRLARDYDAVLPTHEQAWLIAAGRVLLPPAMPVAVARGEAFDRVQSKVEFARLLDKLGVEQPSWWLPEELPADAPARLWVKAAFSTAGRGVRLARSPAEARREVARHVAAGMPVMLQEDVAGRYGQAQAVFAAGRMIAVHTSVADGVGMGGSAAARLSVDHPDARDAIERVGSVLGWHGGLTLDYIHREGRLAVIECNPRTVEPGNATAAGVNLPRLTIDLTLGRVPEGCLVGRPGVRTHSALALALGAAATTGSRRAVLRAVSRGGGPLSSREVLTPVVADPACAVACLVPVGAVLVAPRGSDRLAASAVGRYAITPDSIATVREEVAREESNARE